MPTLTEKLQGFINDHVLSGWTFDKAASGDRLRYYPESGIELIAYEDGRWLVARHGSTVHAGHVCSDKSFVSKLPVVDAWAKAQISAVGFWLSVRWWLRGTV